MSDNADRPSVYNIPSNYTDSGKILGLFELRNAIEAGVLAVVVGFPLLSASMSLPTKIVTVVLGVGLVVFVAGTGIGGDSLTQYLHSIWKYLRNKRKLKYRRVGHGAKRISHEQHQAAVQRAVETVNRQQKAKNRAKKKKA